MADIFLTRRILEEGITLLKEEHRLDIYPGDVPPSKQEIIEHLQNKQGLLCLLTDPIDREVFQAAPNLKAIATYAVGYNNIDLAEATRRGIPVSNTPGVLTETTADLAWALIMAIARRVVAGDKMVRNGEFLGWGPKVLLGSDVHGKTLGIIGAGRIGQAVGHRAQGFNMHILYHNRTRKPAFEKDCGAHFVDVATLLRKADYVTLHVPLTEQTYHLIGKSELDLMQDTAFLINTARGQCIDEQALVASLREGGIAGAALDVFEDEPTLTAGLVDLDNVILCPHAGSASVETRTKMAVMVARDLLAMLQGKIPLNCVNPEVYD
jgi:glyoxylate reductase